MNQLGNLQGSDEYYNQFSTLAGQCSTLPTHTPTLPTPTHAPLPPFFPPPRPPQPLPCFSQGASLLEHPQQ